MLETLNGSTRLYALIGHPIAQVQSPSGVTRSMQARGVNAVMVPVHVEPDGVDALIDALGAVRNLDGICATIPHKFAAFRHAATASGRARLLEAANVLRRNADGTWHGDMLDGLGMSDAIRAKGCDLAAQHALLIGAGGAGRAIALDLLDAGVRTLAIHDVDTARRDALMARLAPRFGARAGIGSDDPAGASLVVNATPMGMRAGDPLPVRREGLAASTLVADAVTRPEVTPLLDAARAIGCATVTGVEMYEAELGRMVEFWLAGTRG
jgi:shikimate dehydrogenase